MDEIDELVCEAFIMLVVFGALVGATTVGVIWAFVEWGL